MKKRILAIIMAAFILMIPLAGCKKQPIIKRTNILATGAFNLTGYITYNQMDEDNNIKSFEKYYFDNDVNMKSKIVHGQEAKSTDGTNWERITDYLFKDSALYYNIDDFSKYHPIDENEAKDVAAYMQTYSQLYPIHYDEEEYKPEKDINTYDDISSELRNIIREFISSSKTLSITRDPYVNTAVFTVNDDVISEFLDFLYAKYSQNDFKSLRNLLKIEEPEQIEADGEVLTEDNSVFLLLSGFLKEWNEKHELSSLYGKYCDSVNLEVTIKYNESDMTIDFNGTATKEKENVNVVGNFTVKVIELFDEEIPEEYNTHQETVRHYTAASIPEEEPNPVSAEDLAGILDLINGGMSDTVGG